MTGEQMTRADALRLARKKWGNRGWAGAIRDRGIVAVGRKARWYGDGWLIRFHGRGADYAAACRAAGLLPEEAAG